MAGKTGTSQVRNITAAERARGVTRNEDLPWERRDHALFVNFAPADNPRIAVAVEGMVAIDDAPGAGDARWLSGEVSVDVDDGQLDLAPAPGSDGAVINTIEITPLPGGDG